MSQQREYFKKLEEGKQNATECMKPTVMDGKISDNKVPGGFNKDGTEMSSVASRRLFFENMKDKDEEENHQRSSRKYQPGRIKSHIVS